MKMWVLVTTVILYTQETGGKGPGQFYSHQKVGGARLSSCQLPHCAHGQSIPYTLATSYLP
jgi:hypothetical protein